MLKHKTCVLGNRHVMVEASGDSSAGEDCHYPLCPVQGLPCGRVACDRRTSWSFIARRAAVAAHLLKLSCELCKGTRCYGKPLYRWSFMSIIGTAWVGQIPMESMNSVSASSSMQDTGAVSQFSLPVGSWMGLPTGGLGRRCTHLAERYVLAGMPGNT